MSRRQDSWGYAEGDAITSDLTAMRRLGGGSAYEVYLAFDEVTFMPVVVKLLRPSQVANRLAVCGIRRELEVLSHINHPVIVRRLRSMVDGDRPHLVLEHIDGPRLSTLLRRHGPLVPQQYLSLAIEVAAALHYLRDRGYVHLDVKPSNIVMGAPARLIDLSVARSLETADKLTYPVGTNSYMSPEQCNPPETGHPGFPSDVWGLGATLFKAVAGYKPFDEGDPDADEAQSRFPQLAARPRPLPKGVPGDVATVVYACLEPEPARRPLPREVALALEPAVTRSPPGRLTFKVR
jgi:eukaryotic-like serine/threonine-protein kinase